MFESLAVKWVLARLQEPSTWAGFAIAVQQPLHIHFNSNFQTSLVHLGLAVAGVIAVVMKEGIKS
jgi:hypothetical protein